MCSASIQVVSEATKRLFIYIRYIMNYTNEIPEVNMNIKQPIPIIVMCITIGKDKLLNIMILIFKFINSII
jgi:hypothetical protein